MLPPREPAPVGGPGAADDRLPLWLDLRGRRVLVVGGGPVGTRRAERLLRSGASVTVVAPVVTTRLHDLLARDAGVPLTWTARPFIAADLAGAWLVQCATGDPAADRCVAEAAEAARVWCVLAGDGGASSAWSAAESVVDGMRVAVSGGGDPGRAVRVRDGVAAALRDGSIPTRRRRRDVGGGRVWLVGAGPGDPDLMTLRGRRVLADADVVLVDHLVPAAVLRDLDPSVEVIDVGKRPGSHAMEQAAIDALLVARARAGQVVVRLKGGDPFVLGRGGEEALACLRAGVPVAVVPGVTSAVAAPAAAGIPVTHRGITSSYVVLSGHAGLPALLAQATSAPADATLVLLMATRRLAEIAVGLQGAGRPGDTPVAVVAHAWTPRQATLVSTLDRVAADIRHARVTHPAVVVVGDVVRLRDVLGDLAAPSADAGHVDPDGSPLPHPAALD